MQWHLSIPSSHGLIPVPIGKKIPAAIVRRKAMREGNGLRMMSQTGSMVADDAHGSIPPMRPNPSLRFVASTSMGVAHLVRRAMTFLDTNREAARCCLQDASRLLGAELEDSVIDAPKHYTCRAGGLATWQAERVMDFVEANLGLKVATEEMANVAALSKSHFSRAFKHSLGYTPMAYVTLRRVERAKLMMTSTGDRLTDIALACGFADQSHLNRYFRRVVGTSPGHWRRMSQYAAH
jgi:AraC family transcriptional regulator